MSGLKFETLEGTLEYAAVHRPVAKYGSDTEKEFSLKLVLDEDQEKALLAVMEKHNIPLNVMGHDRIKTDKNGNRFIKLRKNAISKKTGKENFVPVVDADGNRIDKDVLIGNGSKGKVKVMIFNYGPQDLGAIKLSALMITDLIEYKPEDKSASSESSDSSDSIFF